MQGLLPAEASLAELRQLKEGWGTCRELLSLGVCFHCSMKAQSQSRHGVSSSRLGRGYVRDAAPNV